MLPERLKILRKQRRKTQQQIADLLGISRQAYSYYENGSRQPDIESLQKLSDYFDVSIDSLVSGKEHSSTVTVAGRDISLTLEELNIFEELKRHPILFHDLATDPEQKIKELIKLQKMKKLLLEEDEEDPGEGFGDLED